MDPRLAPLLDHPGIWRARGMRMGQGAGYATGFAEFDAYLPDSGWPGHGLVEVSVGAWGCGELALLIPLLRQLHVRAPHDWLFFIAPPYEPYAPAFAAEGLAPDRVLVVRTREVAWTMEQCLQSSTSRIVLGWHPPGADLPLKQLRRLQLAADRADALAVLYSQAARTPRASPACLRLALEATPDGMRLEITKNRGGRCGVLLLDVHG